jgi:hypothetical protein
MISVQSGARLEPGPKARRGGLTILILALAMANASSARGAEQDLQNWSLVNFHHHFDERWAAAFQVENRVADNITQFDELILKPGGYYRFSKLLKFGLGYKYQKKHEKSNEQDIWQELYFTPSGLKWSWTHQVRLEERFIDDLNGVIPRLRYLVHIKHPLGTTGNRYFAFSEAVRFNLTDKGAGPVAGFEQNRIYFGVGFKTTRRLNIELGYLWRYERKREGPDASDHVIRLQFLFDTKGRHASYAGS